MRERGEIQIYREQNPNNFISASISSDLSKFLRNIWNGGVKHTAKQFNE